LFLIPLALGILTWMNGIKVVRSGASSQDGVPAGMTFFMGAVMLLAAAGDIRMLVRGGVFVAKRIARYPLQKPTQRKVEATWRRRSLAAHLVFALQASGQLENRS
jgi:hypothetical protein